MKYQCKECGAKAKTLVKGHCPACGSAKLKSLDKTSTSDRGEQEIQSSSPIKKVLLVTLWGLLVYKAYEIFFSSV